MTPVKIIILGLVLLAAVQGMPQKVDTITSALDSQPLPLFDSRSPADEDDQHEPYDFNYAVKDDFYGTDFSHNAASDGDVVKGEYRVLLPDGRTQIVRYTADSVNGYNAVVSYEGTANPASS